MMQYLDEDTQRGLDQFNQSQGGPARIELCWHPYKDRWAIFAVPQDYGTHPLAKNWVTPKLMTPFPDGSGRQGVALGLWQGANGEYLPIDERFYEALRYADSFRSKDHYDEVFTQREQAQELEESKRLRDIAYGAKNYWFHYDRVIKSMNPANGSTGDWRASKGFNH